MGLLFKGQKSKYQEKRACVKADFTALRNCGPIPLLRVMALGPQPSLPHLPIKSLPDGLGEWGRVNWEPLFTLNPTI